MISWLVRFSATALAKGHIALTVSRVGGGVKRRARATLATGGAIEPRQERRQTRFGGKKQPASGNGAVAPLYGGQGVNSPSRPAPWPTTPLSLP